MSHSESGGELTHAQYFELDPEAVDHLPSTLGRGPSTGSSVSARAHGGGMGVGSGMGIGSNGGGVGGMGGVCPGGLGVIGGVQEREMMWNPRLEVEDGGGLPR